MADIWLKVDNLADLRCVYGDQVAEKTMRRLCKMIEVSSFGISRCERSLVEPDVIFVVLNGVYSQVTRDKILGKIFDVVSFQSVDIEAFSICVSLSVVPRDSTGEVLVEDRFKVSVRNPHYMEKMQEAVGMLRAVEQRKVRLAYQPVRSTSGEELLYSEGLCRMSAAVSPHVSEAIGGKIWALEDLGLIRSFDRYIVLKTIDDLKHNRHLRLGCNISAQSLALDERWMSIINELEMEPSLACRLVIEVTETARVSCHEKARGLIALLKGLGCRIAVDDFGSGNMSIRQAELLQPDIVKIDRAFLQRACTEIFGLDMFEAVIGVASQICHHVVVEGVETDEQLKMVEAAGVRWVQGYRISRPSFLEVAPNKTRMLRLV